MDEATKEKLINSLKDIHGFVEIQIPLWWLITFSVIILIPIIYFIWKKYKKDIVTDTRTKTEIILDEIKSLEQENNTKNFYINYSELTREYFDYRFGLNFVDKTTKEIEKEIYKFEEIATNQAKLFIKSLERADLAKFAKKEFKEEEKLQDLYDAIELIYKIEEKITTKNNEEKELEIS